VLGDTAHGGEGPDRSAGLVGGHCIQAGKSGQVDDQIRPCDIAFSEVKKGRAAGKQHRTGMPG
jgi:hypothetical protein